MRFLVFFLFLFATESYADELRPAYIELTEQHVGEWSVVWKVSARSTLARNSQLRFPTNCHSQSELTRQRRDDNLIQSLSLRCDGDLSGEELAMPGLAPTSTDALVRIQPLNQDLLHLRLTPRKSTAIIPGPQDDKITNVAYSYGLLGIEHILEGLDHVLFVVLMVLLIRGWRSITWTVTAFTIAHSITLIGATIGLFGLAQKPVEVVIALSIVFMAVEVIKSAPAKLRLSERMPWIVAFAFGLLHGFGFAGALTEIGLPSSDRPLALLSFNVGIELGQLAIVALLLCVSHLLNTISPNSTRTVKAWSAYLIGITATYWFFERLQVMLI